MSGVMGLVEQLVVQTRSGEQTGASLLQLLREEVSASTGQTKGGASSQWRIPLDVATFQLFEDITGQIASEYAMATEFRPNRAPEVNLFAWAVVFAAAQERGEVTEVQVAVAVERLEGWVRRIREHFDRPTVKEITAPCPQCGLRYVQDGAGDRVAALTATIRAGQGVQVACGNCTRLWAGKDEVIQLGSRIGVRLDPDAIREALVPGVGVEQAS